jgi:hypothetical protein
MQNITCLCYLSVQIEANIYGSVENTVKLNNSDLIIIWNSRQLWINQTSLDILNCNTIGHRSEVSRALLIFEYTKANISLFQSKRSLFWIILKIEWTPHCTAYIRVPVGPRIFTPAFCPDRLWGPLSLLSNGNQGQTTRQQLLRSRKCGSILPLSHTSWWQCSISYAQKQLE